MMRKALCSIWGWLLMPVTVLVGGSAVEVYLDGTQQQVRVEGYDASRERWLPVASGYPTGSGAGWLKIALPDSWADGQLRVVASNVVSPFSNQIESAKIAEIVLGDTSLVPGMAFMTTDTASTRESQAVIEEADIWSWQGSHLFIYNQYRGLQVLDLGDASEPRWLDAYRYPARGEDLYAMQDGTVVILGTGYNGAGADAEVQILHFDGQSLSHKDTVSLGSGSYVDSRRYDDTLYVMVREWEMEEHDNTATQRPVMKLHAIALQGTGERLLETKVFRGSGWLDAVMTAQPEGILVCVNQWAETGRRWRSRWYSDVHVLRPAPDGTLEELGTATLKGVVKDKFKLNFDGEVLTTLSQETDFSTGAWSANTHLENFAIRPDGVEPLGSLLLAPGETLFATRFYGDTIYVVTFLMVDPLFAIDNSDPAKPRVVGELKVPGWSNYIEWVDQWLFAIGYEENRMTVSTFDVSDPANMVLQDRIFLSEDSWVGSEAQYDDQAISFFPEKRLFMLPFQTYSWERAESIQAMQVISWDEAGRLQLRGAVAHLDVPRRGVLQGDTMVTISGQELRTTDLRNPDLPQAGGKTLLAWNVTQLHVVGDHILQIEERPSSGNYLRIMAPNATTTTTSLIVTAATDPNRALAEIPLGEGVVVGSHVSGQHLTLVQERTAARDDPWMTPEQQSLTVSVYDFSDPLSPVKLSETLAEIDYIGERLNAQPYGSHLIWTNTGNAFGYGYFYIDAIFPGVGARNPAYLVTRSDSASGEVAIVAHGVLPGGKEYYSPFSGWQWAAPVMLVSVSHGDYIEGPEGQTYQRETLLHAVDFSDPAAPVSLTPVRLPAELKSLSRIGGGPEHYLYFGGGSGVNVWGWDGVTAFKIFSQTLPTGPENSYWSASEWVGPLLVRSGADYSLSPARQQLEFWWHDAANQTFVSRLTDVFPEGTDWPQDTAVVDNVLLQSMGSGRILTYALRPDSGEIVELTDQPTAMGNGYSYILEGSAVDGAKAYVPAGVYGVEPIDLGQVGIRGEDVRPRRLLSDDDVWYPVSEDKWTVVDAKTSSRAGAIRELRWLYRADSMREVDPAAADAGDMWRESGWLGWYAHSAQAPDWIQHLEHGHLYTVVTEDPTRDGVYFFDAQLGYMWTSGQTYPWLYRYEGSEWLYYLRGTGLAGKRWFSGTRSGWIALDR